MTRQVIIDQMAKRKFSTKLSDEAIRELRGYAAESKRAIADIVDEAVLAHLRNIRVRPAFKHAVNEVIEQHAEALKRLAK
ncbi:MAG: hypothetical protein J5J00_14345 [Deltaproteobacteria bacterium]|nr:hypothetical protein [Deltaproteobacteria bacterium]